MQAAILRPACNALARQPAKRPATASTPYITHAPTLCPPTQSPQPHPSAPPRSSAAWPSGGADIQTPCRPEQRHAAPLHDVAVACPARDSSADWPALHWLAAGRARKAPHCRCQGRSGRLGVIALGGSSARNLFKGAPGWRPTACAVSCAAYTLRDLPALTRPSRRDETLRNTTRRISFLRKQPSTPQCRTARLPRR